MYNEDTIRNVIANRDIETLVKKDFLDQLNEIVDDAFETKKSIENGTFSKLIGLGCLECIQEFPEETNKRIIMNKLRKCLPSDMFEIRVGFRTYDSYEGKRGYLDYYIYNKIHNVLYQIEVNVKMLDKEPDGEWFSIRNACIIKQVRLEKLMEE